MKFIVKFFQESIDNFPRSSWSSKSQFQKPETAIDAKSWYVYGTVDTSETARFVQISWL